MLRPEPPRAACKGCMCSTGERKCCAKRCFRTSIWGFAVQLLAASCGSLQDNIECRAPTARFTLEGVSHFPMCAEGTLQCQHARRVVPNPLEYPEKGYP